MEFFKTPTGRTSKNGKSARGVSKQTKTGRVIVDKNFDAENIAKDLKARESSSAMDRMADDILESTKPGPSTKPAQTLREFMLDSASNPMDSVAAYQKALQNTLVQPAAATSSTTVGQKAPEMSGTKRNAEGISKKMYSDWVNGVSVKSKSKQNPNTVIAELNSTLSGVRKQVAEYEAKAAEADRVVSTVRQLVGVNGEGLSNGELLNTLSTSYNKIKSNMLDNNQKAKMQRESFEAQKKSFQEELSAKDSNVKRLQSELESLQKEYNDMKAATVPKEQLVQMEAKLKSATAELQVKQLELANMTEAHGRGASKIQVLENDLLAKSNFTDSLRAEIVQKDHNINVINGVLAEARAKLESTQKEYSEYSSKSSKDLAELGFQLQNESSRYTKVLKEKTEAFQKIEELSKTLSEKDLKLEEILKKERPEIDNRMEGYKVTAEMKKQELADLSVKYKDSNKALSEALSKAEKAEKELAEAKIAVSTKDNANEILKSQLAAEKQKFETRENELKTFQELEAKIKRETGSESVAEVKKELEATRHKLYEADAKLKYLNDELVKARKDANGLFGSAVKHEQALAKIEVLEAEKVKVRQDQDRLDKMYKEVEDAAKFKEVAKTRIAELNDQLKKNEKFVIERQDREMEISRQKVMIDGLEDSLRKANVELATKSAELQKDAGREVLLGEKQLLLEQKAAELQLALDAVAALKKDLSANERSNAALVREKLASNRMRIDLNKNIDELGKVRPELEKLKIQLETIETLGARDPATIKNTLAGFGNNENFSAGIKTFFKTVSDNLIVPPSVWKNPQVIIALLGLGSVMGTSILATIGTVIGLIVKESEAKVIKAELDKLKKLAANVAATKTE